MTKDKNYPHQPIRISANRKCDVVLQILKGNSTIESSATDYGVEKEQVQKWVRTFLDAGRESLRTRPRAQVVKLSADIKTLRMELDYKNECVLLMKKAIQCYQSGIYGREMLASLQSEAKERGYKMSIVKLCRLMGLPRSTAYYKPHPRLISCKCTNRKPTASELFAEECIVRSVNIKGSDDEGASEASTSADICD